MNMGGQYTIVPVKKGMEERLREIDVIAWGESSAASVDQLRKRIERFPQGNFAAVDHDGNLLGSVWSVGMDTDYFKTWYASTGNGIYDNADPNGRYLFGVNASSLPDAPSGIGTALIEMTAVAGFLTGKHWRFGGRIPEYHLWQRAFAVEDYVRMQTMPDGTLFFTDPDTGTLHHGPNKVELSDRTSRVDPRTWPVADGKPGVLAALDEELHFFLQLKPLGIHPRIIRVLPDYFRDPPSLNYGVLMGEDNPYGG